MVVVGGANMDVKARSAPRRRAGHQQPRHRRRWRPAASAATSPRTSPASAPAPTSSPRSAPTASATRCWPRPRRPACTSSTYAAARARPAPTRPCSTPPASWSSRSPTWPPPTSSAPEQVNAARDLVAAAGAAGARRQPGRPRPSRFALDLATAAGVRVVLEPVSVPEGRGARAGWSPRTGRCSPSRPTATSSPRSPACPTRTDRQVGRPPRPARPRRRATSGCGSARRGSLLSSPDGHASPRRRTRPTSSTSPAPATRCSPPSATRCSRGDEPAAAAAYGHAAAALTIASPHTVRPDLTDRLVRSTTA